MAENSPSFDSSTRWLETSRGILRYSELAPLLAERVLRVQERIDLNEYSRHPLNEGLICALHWNFCGDLVPEWAGRWRKIDVQVGSHQPPSSPLVPMQMRDYVLDLEVRLLDSSSGERLLETLAFAEGRFLSIHPFTDLNGRLIRLWLWELMRRLRIPPVTLAPSENLAVKNYLNALAAADRQNFEPLINVWKQRLTR